ncbi:MAG: SusC/RagA family TonB-linked outer membrane protein [Alistipes sp.]|jgi:TonB-linked SusC/RagA family outer membrane protein|nr:SusC/RagA family TonB-linked outer membrane protein [Alistipes sp.]
MKKIFTLLLCCVAFAANAQVRSISGTVVSGEDGNPVAGVMVLVEGTNAYASTDGEGRYTISAAQGSSLSFNLLGYNTQNVTVGTASTVDVILAVDATQIDEVVVTALGILRKEKSLTYSTQVVAGDELTRVKDPNMINALAGKTAGVQINRSSSGLAGSAKVVIRGNRSLGNNQPLYVIDGMPIGQNSQRGYVGSTVTGENNAGNRDQGDAMSLLNPDDIESMSILKGPSAAALYGTSAANGVILITTKKGKAGRTDVTFSTNTTFDSAVHGRPEFQNSYGGVDQSWGARISGTQDYLDKFFSTGVTSINSVALSAGNDKVQNYFSYANTSARGVINTNKLEKHNFNFRESAKFFDDRLTVDANINVVYQKQNNLVTPGGYYMNPLVALYRFPRGGYVQDANGGIAKNADNQDMTFDYYMNNYTYFDEGRHMTLQNWRKTPDTWEQNPFWLTNKYQSEDIRFRTLANLLLAYKFNDKFSLQARGRGDFNASNYEMKMYAGTTPALATGNNGRYAFNGDKSIGVYGDVILTYNQTFGDWAVSGTLGGSISDGRGLGSMGNDSAGSGLAFPNVFSVANIVEPGLHSSAGKYRGSQDQAVFFAGQLTWKDQLFLDVTARNDWTSNLAYTDFEKSGFFYPSVGLSWLMNESIEMPSWVNLGKVRASWSQVGNGAGGDTHPLNSIGGWPPSIGYNNTAPLTSIKPEMITSYEFGTEWRLFGSRLEFDFTYYQTHTRNQVWSMGAPVGSRYSNLWVNAGHIKNEGVEIVLGGTPILTNEFSWRTGFNFSWNRNTVEELVGDLDGNGVDDMTTYSYGGGGPADNFELWVTKGGEFGDIYGTTFMRDGRDANGNPTGMGNIQYGDDGLPLIDKNIRRVGNINPDFMLGWQNTITYKGINLYFLIDGRFGGDVVSFTQADLDDFGVSMRTGQDRDRGYVEFDGKQITNIEGFYDRVGNRAGAVTEHYVYDATNIRLRELSLGYSLPVKWFRNSGWIKGVDASLVGRNLFFFVNKAPYDPDSIMSTGNTMQALDAFGMPSLRSIGFNIKLNF